jgi:hypothetical protein
MAGAPPPGLGTTQPKVMSALEIANVAREAGFRDDQPSNDQPKYSELQVAVAIAFAESGGRPTAVNSIGATGLWQIYPGNSSLLNANANAQAAYAKYRANDSRFGKGPGSVCLWTVFCSQAYRAFLKRAQTGVASTHRDRPAFTGGGTGAVHDAIAFTGNVAHDLGLFFSFITSGSNWIRLGEAIGGAALIFLALYLLFVHTSAAPRAIRAQPEGAI